MQRIELIDKYLLEGNWLFNDDQALLSAFYKNTSIIALHSIVGWINNDETRRHVAPIMHRNLLMANIDKYLLGGGTIITPLGRWSQVLAEVGHGRVRHDATHVYIILQAVLAQWVESTQSSQRPQQVFEQQQLDLDESRLIEPVAQPDLVSVQAAATTIPP